MTSRSHSRPLVKREIFVELSAEDAQEGKLGQLSRALRGMRGAANGWEDFFFQDKLNEAKYVTGSPCACASQNGHDSSGAARGDDLAFEGEGFQLGALEDELKKRMIAQRNSLLGPDVADDTHAIILNRSMSYVDARGRDRARMEIEPDPRHAEILAQWFEAGIDADGERSELLRRDPAEGREGVQYVPAPYARG